MKKFIYLIVLNAIFTCGLSASEPCQRILERVTRAGLLPIPVDAVSSLKTHHWTLLPERKELLKSEVQEDLIQSFNRIFTDYDKEPYAARVLVGGLTTYQPTDTVNVAKGLKPETIKAIDAWASDSLDTVRKATGENLEIANISIGRGHRVGSDDGTLIHADNRGTYLHGLVTLSGPTTVVFPHSPELANHRLLSVDPKTGVMKVQKNVPRGELKELPFEVSNGGDTHLGETLIFGGFDYSSAKEGRTAIQHASPPTSDLNRLTLFISFRPSTNK